MGVELIDQPMHGIIAQPVSVGPIQILDIRTSVFQHVCVCL